MLHAFLCYIDRLEVCGWWADKERFYKKGHRVTSVCFPVFKSLSREENVLHAFLCYIDRLEVCGWWADKERFYKKGHRVTSVCFPVFKHRGIHYPTKFAGLPPERETFCMLPLISLSHACQFFLKSRELNSRSCLFCLFFPRYNNGKLTE